MTFDYAFILSTLPAFLKAVGVTLQVGFIAIGTSLLVALINATILVLRTPYLQRLVGLYVELARNTPLLIQLFFVYFALPALGISVSGFAAAIITMTFLGGAYLTEVLRAGVDAVPQAQLESGRSIGLSHGQLLRYVILPQAASSACRRCSPISFSCSRKPPWFRRWRCRRFSTPPKATSRSTTKPTKCSPC